MISYKDARNIVMKAGENRGFKTEILSIQDAVGRVCAENISAPIDIQPFDNSAMDGFAVRCEDLEVHGGNLIKSGMIAAGDAVPDGLIQTGQCMEIMTGAPVPSNTGAVVPVELTEISPDGQIHFSACPKEGANIRRAGEDFTKGMLVFSAGEVIHPQHIMPLAALGIDKVKVHKKIRAVFLATGNELVEDLSQELKSGEIYNSNRPYGLAALNAMGVECLESPSVPDDPELFKQLLEDLSIQDIDLIISSGAVSAGKFDFVRKGLEQAGAEILFHKVKIKPGKPNLFARLPNGMLYFGLPGNPVATTAGLRFFVQPCMRAMIGMGKEEPVKAKVLSSFKKREGLRMFLKAYVKTQNDGMLTVDLLEGQASFMVNPFLKMNCWAVAQEGIEEINVGDYVGVYPLYPHAGLI